ncbi:sugar transferase [bacterium]|nr:sugar transferase [bacterium]
MIQECIRPSQTAGPSPGTTSICSRTLKYKRMIDLFLCVLLSLPALLLVGVFAGLTRLLTGGPALYRQTRVGFRGRPIEVWKMRTMHENAEALLAERLQNCQHTRAEWNQNFKLRNDPRVIPLLGSFLRRTSLDELPQLLNVWRGEMSFVGPRPLPAYHLEAFSLDFQELRQLVPPGLTGLWQVHERSDGDLASHEPWDTLYIREFSLLNDLKILARTPLVVLRCRGAL